MQTPQQPIVQQQPAPVVQTPLQQQPATPASTTPVTEDNRLVMGAQFQAILTQFQEMGFGKDEIEKCMRAAFNNPERALDYLTGGIPPHLEAIANAPRPQPAAQQPAQQNPAPATTTPPASQQPVSSPQSLQNILQQAQQQAQAQQQFGDLASIMPQFNQLRAAIQQNPELLQPLMQRIAQQNPQLFQIISQNPQEFIRMLNEPVPQSPLGQGQGQGQGQGAFGGQQRPPAPQGTIYITQQEKEAIDRLVDMGFDRLTATQAYFACDKNFELAANFLLESGTFGMDEGDNADYGDAGDDEDIYGGDQQQ